MTASSWIEQSLYRLANDAWSARRFTATPEFVLSPVRLPRPDTAGAMTNVVEALYSHARRWAPGFEVPWHIPPVTVAPLIETPGQFRVDADGYTHIEVASEYFGRDTAVLAILAHEACHHILGSSRIRRNSREENEKLTDLAIFICGFGDLLLNGYKQALRVGSRWASVHLGYLSDEEYRFANDWVLRVQQLVPPEVHRIRSTSLVATIRRWLGGGRAAAQKGWAARSEPVFDATNRRRTEALTRLNGDPAVLERLLEGARQRHPGASELDLLDFVIESLERDRR